jgi:hypothetical protein
VGIKLMNDARGFTCVLGAGGQAQDKGVLEGDMILAIGGTPLPRGTDHSSIGGIIKSLVRPFQMDFLPPNTPDPESYHAAYFNQPVSVYMRMCARGIKCCFKQCIISFIN